MRYSQKQKMEANTFSQHCICALRFVFTGITGIAKPVIYRICFTHTFGRVAVLQIWLKLQCLFFFMLFIYLSGTSTFIKHHTDVNATDLGNCCPFVQIILSSFVQMWNQGYSIYLCEQSSFFRAICFFFSFYNFLVGIDELWVVAANHSHLLTYQQWHHGNRSFYTFRLSAISFNVTTGLNPQSEDISSMAT